MTAKLGSKKLLNAAFGLKIEKGSRKMGDPFAPETPSNRWVLLVVFLVVFVLVGLGRLVDLQVISGSYYRALAEGNRIRRVPIKAPRGEILDRNDKNLARNIPVYKLATFTSGGVVEKTEIISREEALRIQAEDDEKANRLLIDVGREYPLADVTAHVVGYVNEAAPDEIGEISNCQFPISNQLSNSSIFQLGDAIGRMGIEQYYDCVLRGVNGEELIEVDARGRLVRRLGRREPVPGKTIKLTIDSDLQQTAYESLLAAPDEKGIGPRQDRGEKVLGAIVITKSESGEVLALVSVPSFDPNLLKTKYEEYAEDPNLPFFNRAIGGAFHPGSTFKLVTATASVETGHFDANTTYRDEGYVEAGGIKFRNWLFVMNGGKEGEINLSRAITRSTDTFFYKAGETIGVDSLVSWSDKFGLGRKTGIDLPGEITGLLPSPEWKLKEKGERWFLGNTYNMSIGQGDLTATPLQVATFTAAIANGGKICTPHIISEESQFSIFNFQFSNACQDLELRPETLDIIRQGMVGACSPGGTSLRFVNFKHKVACKTGTAQFVEDKTHAWFTVYGPYEASAEEDNSQITATALIEGGGEGSVVAAPVVRNIFEEYFNR